MRQEKGLRPPISCGHLRAEFEAFTPYYYSTYEKEDESQPSSRKKVMILEEDPIESARASNSTIAVSMPLLP